MDHALDGLDGLIDRADGYPVWARVLFLGTLVLVLVSFAVYAALYERVQAAEAPVPAAPAAPET